MPASQSASKPNDNMDSTRLSHLEAEVSGLKTTQDSHGVLLNSLLTKVDGMMTQLTTVASTAGKLPVGALLSIIGAIGTIITICAAVIGMFVNLQVQRIDSDFEYLNDKVEKYDGAYTAALQQVLDSLKEDIREEVMEARDDTQDLQHLIEEKVDKVEALVAINQKDLSLISTGGFKREDHEFFRSTEFEPLEVKVEDLRNYIDQHIITYTERVATAEANQHHFENYTNLSLKDMLNNTKKIGELEARMVFVEDHAKDSDHPHSVLAKVAALDAKVENLKTLVNEIDNKGSRRWVDDKNATQ